MKKFTKFGIPALLALVVVCAVVIAAVHSPVITGKNEGMSAEGPQSVGQPLVDLDEKVEINDGTAESDEFSNLQPFEGIKQPLTWEALNSFPIKYTGMPISEMRQLCVDFFRFAKTALWTPTNDLKYYTNDEKTSVYTMESGKIYGGVPYIGLGSGNVYRLMDFMDETTGKVDAHKHVIGEQSYDKTFTKAEMKYFGNQCSIGSYWGWARIMNSADFKWTQNVVPQNNFVMLGEYEGYDIDAVNHWSDCETNPRGYNTPACIDAVGEQPMYRNYAQLLLGDGLVYYTTAGHLVMCTGEPVVYDTAGNRITDLSMDNLKNITIDGTASYMHITDQATKWLTGTSAKGDTFLYEDGVDTKRSFKSMLNGEYIPFTYEEFLGEDPIEETECSFSYTGNTITWSQLLANRVESNYGISDIYAIVTDDSGAEIYRYIVRTPSAGVMSLSMSESTANPGNVTEVGALTGGTYHLEIVVQLGTGERPTVYTGTLKV